MKIATYRFDDGRTGPARVESDRIVDLRGLVRSVIELLEGGAPVFARAAAHDGPTGPLVHTRLLAPVPSPRAFLGVGLNYRDHAAEVGRPLPEQPVVFAKLLSSVSPPFGKVAAPDWSETFDYEGELGIVMGCDGRAVGYVIVNDFTVRALAKPDTLVLGKSGVGHGPFGPWITTVDEIVDPYALSIATYVNGELRQSSTTAQLHHRFNDLIVFIGRAVRLQAGDIIMTGSPAGSGAGFSPPRWLEPGDMVRVEIEGLGHIEHRIVKGP